jgi:hypothetical protein
MGYLYDCARLEQIGELTIASNGLVAWPCPLGGLEIRGLSRLDNIRRVEAALPSPETDEAEAPTKSIDLGPQYSKDNDFTARMRRHQSWYRATLLRVPCGTGPKVHNKNFFGNMLRPEHGEQGLNFLTPAIHAVAVERLRQNKGAVEPYRLLNNMLSSQPMCFNLFGPMVRDPELATRLWQQVLPGRVAEVTQVCIEYAPTPAEEYLHDRTAFDAFVEYRRPDGKLSFVGVETKLTEPFSEKHYDREEYRRWMRKPGSPWRREAANRVDEVQHNQLWRDHLLSVAMNNHPGERYVDGQFMLVRHPGDAECKAVVRGYQALLRTEDESFLDMPLDELIATWDNAVGEGDEAEAWLKAFTLRYLDLAASKN